MEGVSLSDIAAVSGNDNMWGNGGLLAIILFALIFGNGGWGYGNNRNDGFANAIGYENLATSNEVQRGFDNQNSMANQREILAAVNSGTAQAVAATNQTFHDTLSVLSDKYNELTRDISGLAVGQANQLAAQNQCCCETKMLIQETAAQQRYDSAMQNNAVIQAIQQDGAATRAMYQQDKIEALQNRVNSLETAQLLNPIEQRLSMVPTYPNGFVYNAGNNPFCGCGNWNNCCNV